MNQENVNKLVNWIRANQNYPVDQLRQAVLKGGHTEEDFNVAMDVIKAPSATLVYQGVGMRFIAFFIDSIVFSIVAWLFWGAFIWLAWLIFHKTYSTGYANPYIVIGGFSVGGYLFESIYYLVIFIYYILFEWKIGGTLGKLATGIRVVKSTGEPLDLKASLIRNIIRIVDFLPLFYLVGAISAWNSKTKQRVGDRLAKTVVVSKNSIK